ncbi:MAG TPA: exo-beta-N-acetylmuramidase NamZ domain-containing protein, partial [Negativicutes bacterium]|nr:exo-beta-N-acetylmuramidase NamZ domain-containing protein [Negativicutes bacterium]
MKRVMLTILLLIFMPFCRLHAEEFRYGLDQIDAGRCELKGKRVGLITNAAAISSSGEPGYRVLQSRGVDLKFLMAPEHGFSLDREAGKKVGNSSIAGKLKVYSLYGASRKPDAALLNRIDVLMFDLQDAG